MEKIDDPFNIGNPGRADSFHTDSHNNQKISLRERAKALLLKR
jgi:hypothetical protein